MYPKVKVRSQEEDDRYRWKISPALPGLKALDSLFLEDFGSSGKKESKPVLQELVAKVPSSYNPGSVTPLSASKDKTEGVEEGVKPHIRASSIPRPRAVLSSPDNDEMFGSKTRRRVGERTSALKPHQSDQKKVTPRHSATERPKSAHEVSEEATDKSDSKAHKGSATRVRVRK